AMLRRRGRTSVFVPTGQTGIMIAGWGVSIDEVISDFTAGASEDLVMEAAKTASTSSDIILVEGQGSLVHPGYSGVTLSLIHGSAPDALILCHQSLRTQIRRYTLPIPSLSDLVALHRAVTAPVKAAPVIAISLNTFGMSEEDAQAAVGRATAETGLPATDPGLFARPRRVVTRTTPMAGPASTGPQPIIRARMLQDRAEDRPEIACRRQTSRLHALRKLDPGTRGSGQMRRHRYPGLRLRKTPPHRRA
ncbi:MAG: DUF1611 domain-containing protein, partial [Proteobacteria bacterium]|nr:DUF1611 domain-containing protein [Pseudomonadota bacterium]